MQPVPSIENESARDYRLDIIKAISIVLVLCWHFQPIDITAPHVTAFHISSLVRESIKFFYLQVTLLGVPSFILVSLYLYFQNLNERTYQYIFTRLLHLATLFIFWVPCQIVIYMLVAYPKSTPLLERLTSFFSNISLYNIFVEGGPRLPFVGSSIFYYFTTLFLLTLLATTYKLISKTTWLIFSISVVIIASSLIFFEYYSLKNIYLELLDLRTFIIYIPIAYYLWLSREKFSRSILALLFAGYLLFSVQDYFLRRQGFITNVYLRDSIVFGATTMFYGIKNLLVRKESKVITYLSVYSLGIYATHKYFQFLSTSLLTPLFETIGIGKKTSFGEIRVNIQTLLIALLGILLTFLCVYLLAKTPLKRFVR